EHPPVREDRYDTSLARAPRHRVYGSPWIAGYSCAWRTTFAGTFTQQIPYHSGVFRLAGPGAESECSRMGCPQEFGGTLMAKKKADKRVTKSDFLRKALSRNPNLELKELKRRWAKAGNSGEISGPLYYLIRRELGIKSVWGWFPEGAVVTWT